jgi:hypothetical protein
VEYDRTVPFLGTGRIQKQFGFQVNVLHRFRRNTGIDDRPASLRSSGTRSLMSGVGMWQLLTYLDIIGYRPGSGPGANPSQIQAMEWAWRPALEAIVNHDSGWCVVSYEGSRVYPTDPTAVTFAMSRKFAAIVPLTPPASLTAWLTEEWHLQHGT